MLWTCIPLRMDTHSFVNAAVHTDSWLSYFLHAPVRPALPATLLCLLKILMNSNILEQESSQVKGPGPLCHCAISIQNTSFEFAIHIAVLSHTYNQPKNTKEIKIHKI